MLSPEEYAIADLKEMYLPDVLNICRQELGADYHSEADFRKCLQGDREHFYKVVLNNEGVIFGFTTFLMLSPEAADEYLKLPDCSERDSLLSFRQISISDAMAIHSTMKKKGLGRLLMQAMLNKLMDEGADVFCTMAWKDINGITNAGKLAREIGAEESISIPGYWNRLVSTPEGHYCPVCKTTSCKCFGVLYIRYLNKEPKS